MDVVPLYDASREGFRSWLMIALGAILSASALLVFLARNTPALAHASRRTMPRLLLIALFVLGVSLACGVGPLLLLQDMRLQRAARDGACRSIEGEIRSVRDASPSTGWLDALIPYSRSRQSEMFNIDGETIIVDPARMGLGYKKTRHAGSIIREGRLLRLCLLSRGPEPQDQIILSIGARRANVRFDQERQQYLYRD